MNIESAKLVCFSPTSTSRITVEAIGQGLGMENIGLLDATHEDARHAGLQASGDELLVLAAPVYRGRIPFVLEDWFAKMILNGTPTVCVVVYGNRDYEDALLELSDIVKARGGIPIACGAFIGEHSYSADDTPIGISRPDEKDVQQAKLFGEKIREAMDSLQSMADVTEINVPGNRPYKDVGTGAAVDFIEVGEACTECGVCATVCPVEAIDKDEPSKIDVGKCIMCCACIKSCPEQARSVKEGKVKDTARRLTTMCQARKEPVFFFQE